MSWQFKSLSVGKISEIIKGAKGLRRRSALGPILYLVQSGWLVFPYARRPNTLVYRQIEILAEPDVSGH